MQELKKADGPEFLITDSAVIVQAVLANQFLQSRVLFPQTREYGFFDGQLV